MRNDYTLAQFLLDEAEIEMEALETDQARLIADQSTRLYGCPEWR